MSSFQSVGVIGAGAWGTALAGVAARAGRDVVLYARNPGHAAQMQVTRANPKLPGVLLDARIEVTPDVAGAAAADIILAATPAQHLRAAVDASGAAFEEGHARDRLRQGHRARHA